MSDSYTFEQQHHKDMGHTVVEDIDQNIFEGMPVLDKYSQRIGEVKLYSTVAGYLLVQQEPLDRTFLYIPFRLIRSADPGALFLKEVKDTVISRYTQPPAIRTINETRLVPGPHGNMTPQTRQVQMVESGYDAQQVHLSSVDVEQIAQQLAVGMTVYDVQDKRVGDLTQYDIPRALMVVEKGIFKPTVLLVPFSAIRSVNRDTLSVYLTLPRDVIVKEHTMLPADA